MSELIRIDFEQGVLKTHEHTYHIAKSLSVDRYIEFELMQSAAAYGVTFSDMHKRWCDIEDALNKVKFVEAAAIIANMKEALKAGVDKKKHIVLRVCALFLNEADEDARTFKPEVIDAKIQDWLAAGVDYRDFFQLTVNLVPGLLTVLEQTSTAISTGAKVMQEAGTELLNTLQIGEATSNDSGS